MKISSRDRRAVAGTAKVFVVLGLIVAFLGAGLSYRTSTIIY